MRSKNQYRTEFILRVEPEDNPEQVCILFSLKEYLFARYLVPQKKVWTRVRKTLPLFFDDPPNRPKSIHVSAVCTTQPWGSHPDCVWPRRWRSVTTWTYRVNIQSDRIFNLLKADGCSVRPIQEVEDEYEPDTWRKIYPREISANK